ncbi:hypothetical protein EDD90_9786 [Streptomyces sp. Ag109_O5-1]|nr:hypothetical protein EDD90_9786 [Streptomyces sp. Ag109_O5-1]
MASCAIWATVAGVVPPEPPTPVLSKAMALRSRARASTSAGSQLSRLPLRWISSTSGTPPSPVSRYAYSMPLAAVTLLMGAWA